jgi:hypothetical protein
MKTCTSLVLGHLLKLPPILSRSSGIAKTIASALEVTRRVAPPSDATSLETTIPQLLGLMHSSLPAVRTAAYAWLQALVATSVQALSVEAELAEEGSMEISLPPALLQTLSQTAGPLTAWLMAWQVSFEYLANAVRRALLALLCSFHEQSATVRSAYIDNLRTQDLLGQSLLPSIFALLNEKTVSTILPLYSINDVDLTRGFYLLSLVQN